MPRREGRAAAVLCAVCNTDGPRGRACNGCGQAQAAASGKAQAPQSPPAPSFLPSFMVVLGTTLTHTSLALRCPPNPAFGCLAGCIRSPRHDGGALAGAGWAAGGSRQPHQQLRREPRPGQVNCCAGAMRRRRDGPRPRLDSVGRWRCAGKTTPARAKRAANRRQAVTVQRPGGPAAALLLTCAAGGAASAPRPPPLHAGANWQQRAPA